MTSPGEFGTRAWRYREASKRLREAADLAGEAGAPPATVQAIETLARLMADAAVAARGTTPRS